MKDGEFKFSGECVKKVKGLLSKREMIIREAKDCGFDKTVGFFTKNLWDENKKYIFFGAKEKSYRMVSTNIFVYNTCKKLNADIAIVIFYDEFGRPFPKNDLYRIYKFSIEKIIKDVTKDSYNSRGNSPMVNFSIREGERILLPEIKE